MRGRQKRPLVVLDIDGTLLFNLNSYSKCNGAISGIAHAAISQGIDLAIITARVNKGDAVEYTKRQLQRCGIHRSSYRLFLMPESHLGDENWSQYKFNVRKALTDEGFHVILNAGDRWGDLQRVPPYADTHEKGMWSRHLSALSTANTYMYWTKGTLNIKLPHE